MAIIRKGDKEAENKLAQKSLKQQTKRVKYSRTEENKESPKTKRVRNKEAGTTGAEKVAAISSKKVGGVRLDARKLKPGSIGPVSGKRLAEVNAWDKHKESPSARAAANKKQTNSVINRDEKK